MTESRLSVVTQNSCDRASGSRKVFSPFFTASLSTLDGTLGGASSNGSQICQHDQQQI